MARFNMVYPGTWWELMAECARVAPGKEVHELDRNETNDISQALRWPLRLYKEAIEEARDRGEPDPESLARNEVFGTMMTRGAARPATRDQGYA
jgi:hypothetical protein